MNQTHHPTVVLRSVLGAEEPAKLEPLWLTSGIKRIVPPVAVTAEWIINPPFPLISSFVANAAVAETIDDKKHHETPQSA